METKPTESEKSELELKLLRNEVEKLSLEVDVLRRSSWWDRIIGRYLPIVTALLAVGGFWVGLIQYHYQKIEADKQFKSSQEKSEKDRTDAINERTNEIKRAAAQIFWETQLPIYMKASEAAATIASTKNKQARLIAEDTYWMLYWGPLSCVEDITLLPQTRFDVESAMVNFGKKLRDDPDDLDSLKILSLYLARAMRNEIAPSFDLSAAKFNDSKR